MLYGRDHAGPGHVQALVHAPGEPPRPARGDVRQADALQGAVHRRMPMGAVQSLEVGEEEQVVARRGARSTPPSPPSSRA